MGNIVNTSLSFQILLEQLGFDGKEKEKFSPLARYFKNIQISDFDNIDALELEEVAVPDDKLLMSVFAQILTKKLSVLKGFRKDERSVLNYNRKLVSFHFSKLKPERISTKSLGDELKRFEDGKYDLIDMSNNNLHDEDFPVICDALISNRISATVIDLSNNRFGISTSNSPCLRSAYTALERLLHNNNNLFRYVVIYENPIVSYDHYEFFNRLSKDSLGRLIWIPKYWVEGSKWEHFLRDEDSKDTVRTIHKSYFEQ
jgi:hypothetical protein